MAIKPKFQLDEHSTKKTAAKQFTDRKENIQSFKDDLERASLNVSEFNVLNYYGIGGIGKSSLGRELVKSLQKINEGQFAYALVDMQMPNNRNAEGALFQLRRGFYESAKLNFPLFDLAYALYWQRLNPQIPMKKENFPFLENSEILNNIMAQAGNYFPVIGTIPKLTKLFSSAKIWVSDWWTVRGEKALAQVGESPQDVLERLPLYFAEDLKQSIDEKNIKCVFFIDTYEALWEGKSLEQNLKLDDWVRELIANFSGQSSLFVILGREKLRWEEIDEDWGKFIDHHILGALSSDDAKSFLKSCDVNNEEILDIIIQSSSGVPFFLDLSVDTYHEIKDSKSGEAPAAEDFKNIKTQRDIYERFIRYLNTNELETLKLLSVPRIWDYDLFFGLIDQFKTGYIPTKFKDLTRFSFIEDIEKNNIFTVQKLMRKSLLEHQDKELFERTNKYVYDYHVKILESVKLKGISRTQKIAFKEAFFHGKLLSERKSFFEWYLKVNQIFFDAAKFALVLETAREALDILKGDSENQEIVASVYSIIGNTNFKMGKHFHAYRYNLKALYIRKKYCGEDHIETAIGYNDIGDILYDTGKFDKAKGYYEKSLSIARKLFGDEHEVVAENLKDLGNVFRALGQYDEALTNLEKAILIFTKLNGEVCQKVSECLICIGWNCENKGLYDRALEYYKKSLEISVKIFDEEHPSTALCYSNIGDVYNKHGKYDEALKFYEKALEIRLKIHNEIHPEIAGVYARIGNIFKTKVLFPAKNVRVLAAEAVRFQLM